MNETPRKIVRNTLVNSVSFALLFISNLFLLPFIVHRLGKEYYGGIWVIIGTLTAYLGLLDLGTGTAFVKFISEYHTKGDWDRLNQVINSGIVVYAGVGVLLLAMAFLFDTIILSIVGVAAPIMEDARFVFRVGVVVFVLANLSSPLTAVLIGIQRIDLSSYVSMATQVINIIGVIVVLSLGYGVRGLILNNLWIMIFSATCLTTLAFRYVPTIRLGAQFYRSAMVRQFIGYGFNLQVSRLAQIILFQTDRILSLRFFGNLIATYYDIGARLSSAARSITFLSISALIPAFAELEAQEHRDTALLLYRRGTKYVAVAATFVFAFIFCFASDIMAVWMGEEYRASAVFVRVLAVGYFMNIVTGVASSMAAGLGRTEFERRYGVFVSVFNIVATISLLRILGPVGIAIGTSLSLSLGSLYFMKVVHSYLNISSKDIISLFIKPVAVAVASSLCALALNYSWSIQWSLRSEGAKGLVELFAAYSLIYALLTLLFKVFDEYDMLVLRRFLGKKGCSAG